MSGLRDRVRRGLWAALVLGPAVGCGGQYQMAEVRGRVTCDGKPAVGGEVVFEPVNDPARTGRPPGRPGPPSHGTVKEDGTFALYCEVLANGRPGQGGSGALVGPHRVTFEPPRTKRPTLTGDDRRALEESGGAAELKAAEEQLARTPVYAPLSCGNGITPGEVDVKPGTNEFEFKLQPK